MAAHTPQKLPTKIWYIPSAAGETQTVKHNLEAIAMQTLSNPTRFWWISQIPLSNGEEPFIVEVESLEQAGHLIDFFSQYDLYLLASGQRPDFSNAGGVEEYVDGEWTDWFDDETGDEFDDWWDENKTPFKSKLTDWMAKQISLYNDYLVDHIGFANDVKDHSIYSFIASEQQKTLSTQIKQSLRFTWAPPITGVPIDPPFTFGIDQIEQAGHALHYFSQFEKLIQRNFVELHPAPDLECDFQSYAAVEQHRGRKWVAWHDPNTGDPFVEWWDCNGEQMRVEWADWITDRLFEYAGHLANHRMVESRFPYAKVEEFVKNNWPGSY